MEGLLSRMKSNIYHVYGLLNFLPEVVLFFWLQIWPPKMVKDSGSRLHSKLKEAILQVSNNTENKCLKNPC